MHLLVVENLIGSEESQSVFVFREDIHGGKDMLKIDIVVGFLGILSVEGEFWSVDIEDEVDAGVSQELHALCVIL